MSVRRCLTDLRKKGGFITFGVFSSSAFTLCGSTSVLNDAWHHIVLQLRGSDGLLFGAPGQLGVQAVGVLATMLYSGVVSFGLLRLIGVFSPLRADSRQEGIGMDVGQHGEEAYTNGEGAILVLPDDGPAPAAVSGLDRPLGEQA